MIVKNVPHEGDKMLHGEKVGMILLFLSIAEKKEIDFQGWFNLKDNHHDRA
jgi:hypothetical protein